MEIFSRIGKRWKELLILLLVSLLEFFMFSSYFKILPIGISVGICILVGIPIVILAIYLIGKKKPDKKDLLVFLVFLALAIVCGIIRTYLYILSMVIAYIFYDKRNSFYKYMFFVNLGVLSSFIILYMFSLIPDNILIRNHGGLIVNIRHTFGMEHPNHILKFCMGTIMWGYLWLGENRKYTLLISLVSLPVILFIGFHTHCRTGIIAIILLLILMNIPKVLFLIKTKYLYLIFIGVTIALICAYDNAFINDILSTRPYLFRLFVADYTHYMVFGKCYEGLFSIPLDNGILCIVFDGGIVALSLITYLFYKAFKNNNDKKMKVVLLITLIYSMFEVLSIVVINPIYVLMFMELIPMYLENKKQEKNKEVEVVTLENNQ